MRAAIYARMLTGKQTNASKSVPASLDPRKRAFADALGLAVAEQVWREITAAREDMATWSETSLVEEESR
jgi:hypothetical protein